MVQILDQFGHPIRKDMLKQEEATPTLTGVRTIIQGLQTAGLDPMRLAAIMRQADEGDAQSYLEVAEQIEEKDPHYMSVLGTRKRAVAQMDIQVTAASDDPLDVANAELVEEFLKRDELQGELFDILDAIGKGYSVTEIIWDELGIDQWTIKELKWRDPRWFAYDPHDGTTLKLRGEGGQLVDMTPYKYIVHEHKAKSGIAIRAGVIRPCAWFYLFKNFSIKDWVIFAEAYGHPVRIGKYGPEASAEDRAVLARAIRNIGSDFGAIIPQSMTVEFIESAGKTSSTDMFERLCRYSDEQMSKAVLGQTTTTDALSGGGLAGNQAHNEVRGDIADSDAVQLAKTLNLHVVRPLIDLNRGTQRRYPRISIGKTERVDIERESVVADRMIRAGAKISHKKMMDRLGLPMAESDDDVIKPPAPANPMMMAAQGGDAELAAAEPKDAIDALADELAGEWQEVVDPIADAIEKEVAEAKDFEDLKERLLKLAATMDMSVAAEKIGRAMLAARLAGNAGQRLK